MQWRCGWPYDGARALSALGASKWTGNVAQIWKQEVLGRRLKQFVVAAGTSLPSSNLATKVGYTDSPLIRHGPHRKRRLQQFYFCMYSLPWERVYQAVAWHRKRDTYGHKD
jgi:hypothetical protein